MMDSQAKQQLPWYREPWVWFLIILPASAVVAGLTTVYIAMTHRDSLVVDNFQTVGLVAKRETPSDREAATLDMDASVSIDRETGRVIARLEGKSQPAEILLSIHHPTRADFDRKTLLVRDDAGAYRGNIGPGVKGHWYVQLATPDNDTSDEHWRMTGKLPDSGNMVEIVGK